MCAVNRLTGSPNTTAVSSIFPSLHASCCVFRNVHTLQSVKEHLYLTAKIVCLTTNKKSKPFIQAYSYLSRGGKLLPGMVIIVFLKMYVYGSGLVADRNKNGTIYIKRNHAKATSVLSTFLMEKYLKECVKNGCL